MMGAFDCSEQLGTMVQAPLIGDEGFSGLWKLT